MSFSTRLGQDKDNANRAFLYKIVGTHDPSIIDTEGAQGTLYLRVGDQGGEAYLKQDDGCTTNWLRLAVSAGPGPLTAWLTGGNNVNGGVLGTLNADGFDFIVQAVSRGGFFATGERFLKTHGPTFSGSEVVELTVAGTSIGAVGLPLFTLTSDDQKLWKINAEIQGRASDGSEQVGYERKLIAWREGGAFQIGKVHATFTDESSPALDLSFSPVGLNQLQLTVQGLAGKTIYWTGIVRYQGVQDNT